MGSLALVSGIVLMRTARRLTPIDRHEDGRKERHHAQPGEEDGDSRDEAEFLNASKAGEHEDEEAPTRRQGPDQHARSGPRSSDFQRVLERTPDESLFLVAEQEVNPVVDPDPDHDGY